IFALLALASLGVVAPAEPAKPKENLIVHEWGTFLSVQGSDGVTLGGMVDSEEALPDFVETRSAETYNRTFILSKMETPVTYFYTDKPRNVQVRIDMPKGTLTHFYPMPSFFGPEPTKDAPKEPSFIDYRRVHLIPANGPVTLEPGEPLPTLWQVKPGDPWQYA